MREIKFRGKDLNTGEWAYGDLHTLCDYLHIHTEVTSFPFAGKRSFVNPDTIGQYTGLKDNNGKEIYEGDIVSYIITTGGIASEKIPASVAHLVHYDNKHATFKIGYHSANYGTMKEVVDAGNLVVIGNKYDNPELLKK